MGLSTEVTQISMVVYGEMLRVVMDNDEQVKAHLTALAADVYREMGAPVPEETLH